MPRSSQAPERSATQLSFLGGPSAAPRGAVADPPSCQTPPPLDRTPPPGESAAHPAVPAIPAGATFLAFGFGADRRPAAERLAVAEERYRACYDMPPPLIAVPPGDYAEYAALGDPRVVPRAGLAPGTIYLLVAG
jgi:hypothetical protein